MVLSPIDIEQKTFRVALRGYAEEEVDQFLDEIVIAIREYERQLRDANERVAVLEEQLEANRETEDRIKKTLVIAQRTADQVVQEARGEAQQLLIEARTQASEVEVERIQERDNLVADLDRMRSSVAGIRERIVGLANSTLGDLEAIEADIMAVQPDRDDVESWDDLPADLDDDEEGEVSEDESAGDWDDQSPEEFEEDKEEESSGQVILGSGPRPWERNQSDDY
ncbi:MAG: DivIVA domain-containing protein [Acidimicrobiia bacterium]|nr:DivIVA domain-containing protein [Acidimicrobiia bacterium]